MLLGCRNYKPDGRIFILLLISCHHVTMDNPCRNSTDHEVGKKLPHVPSKLVSQIGFMMCFRECEAYTFCLSINYNRKLLVCELNNMKKSASLTLINDSDYMYKEIRIMVNGQTNQCGNVSCKMNSKCVKTTSNTFICIPIIDCIEPVPSLLNGHIIQRTQSPQSVTFNCTSGFEAVGNKSTIYCTPEGKWESLDYGCFLACPVEWKVNAGTQYCFANQSVQWGSAQEKCILMGAHLVEIENAEENNWIQNEGAGDLWWTGGTDVDSEGSWSWTHSNKSMNYTNWSEYQPNGGSYENCALLDDGKFHDYHCSTEHYFICEK